MRLPAKRIIPLFCEYFDKLYGSALLPSRFFCACVKICVYIYAKIILKFSRKAFETNILLVIDNAFCVYYNYLMENTLPRRCKENRRRLETGENLMAICVKSEIGTLKKVLLKRPGTELEHLTPDTLEELLFDDIPFLAAAQQEHDVFAQKLRDCGVEVVYLEELAAEALMQESGLREQFVKDVISQAGSAAQGHADLLEEYLLSLPDAKSLVLKTMSGVTMAEISSGSVRRLSDLVRSGQQFLMPPVPNLYFTRDVFASIGCGVSLNHMHSATRRREAIYADYIFRHHPDFQGKIPFYYTPEQRFSIEGGDILNLSPETLCVGLSQRTQPEAVEILAKNIFADEQSTIRTILAIEIPNTRAFMHLDTVFTQIDYGTFVVHPGIMNTMRIFELTGKGEKEVRAREITLPLAQALAKYLGLEQVTLIRCGGGNQIAAAREQWNDGSNTLCIRPNTIVVYDRNYITNRLLEEAGVEVIKTPSSELSRGRGGPRCMSMPLARLPL